LDIYSHFKIHGSGKFTKIGFLPENARSFRWIIHRSFCITLNMNILHNTSPLKKLLSMTPFFSRFEVKRTREVLGQTVFAPFNAVNNNKQTTSEEQMKFNKWTLGLAAVGAVSLVSAARADEAKMSQVQTALSDTTISGYVNTSMNWEWSPSNGSVNNSPAGNIPLQNGKANGFNLDVVQLTIAKPQDESEWATGYQVSLLFGPDAVGWNPSANAATDSSTSYAIQQAYVALRTPVGNGIDWKVGVFNTIVGYESFDAGSNPNYTRSWGWAVEPTENQGILGSYKINDEFSVSFGVANTLGTGINNRNVYNSTTDNVNNSQWHKTLMGSVTFSAPSSWGWAAGSAFYAGIVYGSAGGTEGPTDTGFTAPNGNEIWKQGTQAGNQANYYLGSTLNSPWKDVTFGAALDVVQNVGGTSYDITSGDGTGPYFHVNDYVGGLYNTIKATDKLSFNSRGEYWYVQSKGGNEGYCNGVSLTETVQYDLYANIVSRLEFRYDKATRSLGGSGTYVLPNGVFIDQPTSYGIYANMIYKF
jgi:hypothetical protein